MYWIDLWDAQILEKCPFKTRDKKIKWLLELFHEQALDDEQPVYEPKDIIAILNWLKLTEMPEKEVKELLYPFIP